MKYTKVGTAKDNEPIYALVLDEYDIHNLIACAFSNILSEVCDIDTFYEMYTADAIIIEPKNKYNELDDHFVSEWSEAINGLLDNLQMLDSKIHNEAEYTC